MTSERPGQIGVTVGICAYNEEKNIGNLLKALSDQRTQVARVDEILVVASGCTDRTPEIVEAFQDGQDDIQLLIESERRGKVSAINEILRRAQGDVVILEGADTIPSPQTVELLTRPFTDPSIGIVIDTLTYGTSQVMWWNVTVQMNGGLRIITLRTGTNDLPFRLSLDMIVVAAKGS